MKKSLLFCFIIGTSLLANAQVTVTTKSFELESQNKHKNWKIIEAGRNSNSQEIYIKFAQSICDVSKSMWTGTRTYKGLKWNIDNLVFSNTFDYIRSDSKKYESSEEALLNNEIVFGKTFMPSPASIGKSLLQGGANLPRRINNAFMFTNVVTGTSGITGFKVNVSSIGCQPLANDTKTHGTICGEIPVVENINSEDAKEQKGQRWIPMYNNPVPNGGNVLFNTVGVSADPNVQYYVFRKYDKDGKVIKEKTFSFDYQCLPTVKEIEKTQGVFDYVLIMATINYKKSKLRVAPANQYEYIRVDGETFEIKEQFTFTTTFSQWNIGHIIEADGAVYLAGVAGEKNSIYLDFSIPKPADYPNFQVVKVANGKLVYANSTTEKQTSAANKTIEGLKNKAPFHYHLNDVQLTVKNGRLILTGQQEIAAIKGSMVTAVFGETGNLEAFIAKSEKQLARGRISFNADGSKLFWLLEDLSEYNNIVDVGNGLVLDPKKAKVAISALTVLTYGIKEKQIIKYQPLINEEWAVNYINPILYENDNELLLLGNKITKKAKEGEIIFITLKK